MWGFDHMNWGLGMLLWLVAIWALVLITFWAIFRNISGPRHHPRH